MNLFRLFAIALLAWGAVTPVAAHPPQGESFSAEEDLPTGATPLAAQVEQAIDRGAEFLLRNAQTGRSGPIFDGYPLGRRALVVYALLESGVDPSHPWIEESFLQMESLPLERVYGVSLYVMALHAYKRAMTITGGAIEEATAVSTPPLPGGGAVRDELKRCIDWLVKVRLRGHGTWGYGVLEKRKNPWTDYSNTQFAVLALHVGVLEGIDIPKAVFEELVGTFSTHVFAARNEIEITVDRAPWIDSDEEDDEMGTAPKSVPLVSRPMSWGYRPLSAAERRSFRRNGSWGTTSMTAAAVSSLMVAQHGLDALNRRRARTAIAIERLVTGGVVELSRAWHPARERTPGSMHRNHYYTLYSLEKAMDLAGIGRLDGVDWYRRQVPHLLSDQAPDGGWGTSMHGGHFEYSQMATAFTLLFLRRATAQLTVHAAPAIMTHGTDDAAGLDDRRVFVESLGGAIDLDELFARLREDRGGRIFPSARQVIAALPPGERPRLLEWFLPLLSEGISEPVRRFARKSIEEITGLPSGGNELWSEWFERWRRLRFLAEEPRGDEHVEEIARILEALELGSDLRCEAIHAFQRTGSLRSIPFLLDALDDRAVEIRTAAHRCLRNLTGESFRYDPAGDPDVRSSDLATWRAWWGSEGERRVAERSFGRLRDRLERARSLEERAELRAELVGLGATILPFVEKVIAEGSYAFDWVLVRESLGGESGIPQR